MSAKNTLDVILAETARRKKICQQLRRTAVSAVEEVQKHACQLGIKDKSWIVDSLWGNCCRVMFKGKNGAGATARLAIFVFQDGQIKLSPAERDANKAYEGYPDVRDDAPELFETAVVEELLICLNRFREEQPGPKPKGKSKK